MAGPNPEEPRNRAPGVWLDQERRRHPPYRAPEQEVHEGIPLQSRHFSLCFVLLKTEEKFNYLGSIPNRVMNLSRRGGVPAKALRSGAGTSYLAEAKDSGEEVRGRLSGHGFSTERREERRRMRSEFPRRGNERADEPESEPCLPHPKGYDKVFPLWNRRLKMPFRATTSAMSG